MFFWKCPYLSVLQFFIVHARAYNKYIYYLTLISYPALTFETHDLAVSWIGFLKHELPLSEMDPTGDLF